MVGTAVEEAVKDGVVVSFAIPRDNKVYRIAANDKSISLFAAPSDHTCSDGALTFDTVGSLGYALIAATGRSGSTTAHGGTVFAIGPTARVRRIGDYHAIGGADEIAIAPRNFGSAAGQVLIPIDAGRTGRLRAVNVHGTPRSLLTLADGLNPIAALTPAQQPATHAAAPGLYITDTLSLAIFVAPASQFASYTRNVIVGSELHVSCWIVRPRGNGFSALALRTTLPGNKYNLEGVVYLAP